MEPIFYLFFKGNCLEAMTHYAEVLGGDILSVVRYGDAPPDDHPGMPAADQVMNMVMSLGHALVMASDNSAEMYDTPAGFRVALQPSSIEEFERVYQGLCGDGGTVQTEPAETFWAERFTMFTDQYGTPWLMNFEGKYATGANG